MREIMQKDYELIGEGVEEKKKRSRANGNRRENKNDKNLTLSY